MRLIQRNRPQQAPPPQPLHSREQLLESISQQLTDDELARLEKAIRNPQMKAMALRFI